MSPLHEEGKNGRSLVESIAHRVSELRNGVIRESFSDFENIEHRLEYVSTSDGVTFINDSRATNVNSAWYALETVQQPIIWIMGGTDKGNDYTELRSLVKQKVKAIICLGVDNTKIHQAFGDVVSQIIDTNSMILAVQQSYALCEPGYTVLLSPACASFDLFENYEDRGEQFKHAVRHLNSSEPVAPPRAVEAPRRSSSRAA